MCAFFPDGRPRKLGKNDGGFSSGEGSREASHPRRVAPRAGAGASRIVKELRRDRGVSTPHFSRLAVAFQQVLLATLRQRSKGLQRSACSQRSPYRPTAEWRQSRPGELHSSFNSDDKRNSDESAAS